MECQQHTPLGGEYIPPITELSLGVKELGKQVAIGTSMISP